FPIEFENRGGCYETVECTVPFCGGEEVVRSTRFSAIVPSTVEPTRYEISFGTCDRMEVIATTETRSFTATNLEEGKAYCWKVDAINACGRVSGPVWTFIVGQGGTFRRGILTGQTHSSLTDAVLLLAWLFLSGPAPSCVDAADMDDSGTTNLSDAIYLLRALFDGGPQLPPPTMSCGVDPTPDALDCEAFSGCG
ncbi:MAG TPA: hypothetical protein VK116_17030, partial [Planctomycetota bacterium]|nr:hypothetical protein [Planctomycetota bacterium]